jgi:hypothetical protein
MSNICILYVYYMEKAKVEHVSMQYLILVMKCFILIHPKSLSFSVKLSTCMLKFPGRELNKMHYKYTINKILN